MRITFENDEDPTPEQLLAADVLRAALALTGMFGVYVIFPHRDVVHLGQPFRSRKSVSEAP